MPPLLPELLTQSVGILIEAPSTDWGPVWVAAAATLVGAALGAGLGGYVAFRGTVKANNSFLQRQKLEEVFSLLLRLEGYVHSIRAKTIFISNQPFIDLENEEAAHAIHNFDLSDVERIRTLLRIYGRGLLSDFTELDDFFRAFEVSVLLGTIEGKEKFILPGQIKNYMAMSTRLKNALIAELKL